MTITLRAKSGHYLCAESGGGTYVVADRIEAGPWEQWTVHAEDDGRYSLQASNGLYLTAELDGSVVVRSEVASEWERFDVQVRDVGVAFLSAHDTYLQAPEGGGTPARVRCVGDDPNLPGEWEFFAPSEPFWLPPTPDTPVCPRPLVGPLRIEDKVFVDDSGHRRVLFCSWFPALRILRDDPTEFYRQLDSITTAGYQGIRVFLAVGGWDSWEGRQVVPKTFTQWIYTGNMMRTDVYGPVIEEWPDYDDLLRELLRACVARKLRLHTTTGDMQIICPDVNDELDLHRRFARICAEEGGIDVIALAETTNEYPINRYGSNSDESVEQMGAIIEVWEDAIPGVLTAQGADPQNEEPDGLARASTFGNTCAVHVTRDPFGVCLKRTLGLVYWEGDYRAFPKPFWEGEPAGPGEDSYCRQDDPANLIALYAMHGLTGQASVWFQGAAVLSKRPLESDIGFLQLPTLLAAHLPEDIATWEHGSNQRGGIEYWWKGKDFVTSTFTEWDPSPPKPIASWTLYYGTGTASGGAVPTKSGTDTDAHNAKGAPYQSGHPRTGLLVGKFA